MKIKALFFSLFVLSMNFGSLQAQALPEEINTGGMSEPSTDESPEFPGGFAEMMKFMHANIKYPKSAIDGNKNGKGMIKVTVMEDGSLSDITVVKNISGCPECDEEAIRVIKTMPKWKPGKVAGKIVPLLYNIPISFKLQQKK